MKYVEQDSKQRTIRRNENIKSSLVWKEKGNTSFKTGDYTDAVECYTKAISLAPDQVVYYSNRAQVSTITYHLMCKINLREEIFAECLFNPRKFLTRDFAR